MAEITAGIQQALTACFSCRTKKRKCDRMLPACSRCARSQRVCQYNCHVYGIENSLSESDEGCEGQYGAGYLFRTTNSRKACKRCRAGKRLCSREYPSCARCTRIGVSCVYTLPESLYWPRGLMASVSTPATPTYYDHNDSDNAQLSSSSVDQGFTAYIHDSPFPPNLHTQRPKPVVADDRVPPAFLQEANGDPSAVESWMQSPFNFAALFPNDPSSDHEHPHLHINDYETLLIERNAILSLKAFLHTCRPEDATDEIICDAFMLAWPADASHTSAKPLLSPLQSPMPLQHIEVVEAHLHGLRYLVEARGGLDKLEMPGLAERLSAFDLIIASRNLSKPHWPVKTALDSTDVTRFLEQFPSVTDTASDRLFATTRDSVDPDAASVLHVLRRYVALLQEYTQGRLEGLDMAYLHCARSIIHHSALSLCEAVGPVRECRIESLRLAVTAFSLLVVFRAPVMALPYPQLAETLRAKLGCVEDRYHEWIGMPEVLVWILIVGTLVAAGTPQQAWYTRKLSWLVSMLGIESWEQMRQVLISMVWIESLCNDGETALWQKIHVC